MLRDGAIVGQGAHEGLLAAGGLYARLYRLNCASFDDLAAREAGAEEEPPH